MQNGQTLVGFNCVWLKVHMGPWPGPQVYSLGVHTQAGGELGGGPGARLSVLGSPWSQ